MERIRKTEECIEETKEWILWFLLKTLIRVDFVESGLELIPGYIDIIIKKDYNRGRAIVCMSFLI